MFGILMKLIFWIGFPLFYFEITCKQNIFKIIKYRFSKKGIVYAFSLAFLQLQVSAFYNFFTKEYFFNPQIYFAGSISAVIAAPVIEETLFRGVILKKMQENMKFAYANIITSILFAAIHLPGWIIWGNGFDIYSFISIFLISLIWGYFYKRTGSIWTTMLSHSLNNIISKII
ncbi:MAG: CPBP family intramembrane metalloprotease [Candidatus Delongbacteria bacterium]|nr:CPBP family intramembrane metalloprotease [Candidatus Delongbacteria bacterium]